MSGPAVGTPSHATAPRSRGDQEADSQGFSTQREVGNSLRTKDTERQQSVLELLLKSLFHRNYQ